jgi:hypothetical protein
VRFLLLSAAATAQALALALILTRRDRFRVRLLPPRRPPQRALSHLRAILLGLLGGTGIFGLHALLLRAGLDTCVARASRARSWPETLAWSFAMGALCTASFVVRLEPDPYDWVVSLAQTLSEHVRALRRRRRPVDAGPHSFAASLPALGCSLGSWSAAVLVPLDWNAPWQRWPVGSAYGGIAGFVVGALLALVVDLMHPACGWRRKVE